MARKVIEPMHDEHVNVTPLIDVVMCLIVFFLMVGKLVKDEQNDKVIIPRAHYGMEMPDQQGRLTINVVPATTLDNGDPIPEGAKIPPTVIVKGQKISSDNGWKELVTLLRKEKSNKSDIKVILRADQNEEYDWIAPVLVACAQADIKDVNFSTKAPD